MTCIVGLVHDGKVYMGGDSAATNAWFGQTVITGEKVFANGAMLFGGCGSFRPLQLLGYGLSIPAYHADVDVYKYMVTDFIDAVRACYRNGGVLHKENEIESGGFFLVGFRGRLFKVQDDFSVLEPVDGYTAIGSGGEIALGALYVTSRMSLTPEERITKALEAAEKFNAGVRRPFRIEVLES